MIKGEGYETITNFLKNRLSKLKVSKRRGLAIVFDVTYKCNLACRGCGVDAKKVFDSTYKESSFKDIIIILNKIKDYLDTYDKLPFFIYFGGGEPFMRKDLEQILVSAKKLFGADCLALDTNGTIPKAEDIIRISKYVDRIGISIDGLEQYHNWWRNPMKEYEKFRVIMNKLSTILRDLDKKNKVEIATVATKKNIDQIPELIKLLINKGIKQYVIHRAMPVGRFSKLTNLIPNASDYVRLLANVAKCYQEYKGKINIRLHHSLEAIYIALFLKVNTYDSSKIGEPDISSCIGIDPASNVYFDPWCIVNPWSILTGGNLLNEEISLEQIFQEGLLSITRSYCAPDVRCLGCDENCSGGSRIAAAGAYISKLKLNHSEITENHILTGLAQIDPACPLKLMKMWK